MILVMLRVLFVVSIKLLNSRVNIRGMLVCWFWRRDLNSLNRNLCFKRCFVFLCRMNIVL